MLIEQKGSDLNCIISNDPVEQENDKAIPLSRFGSTNPYVITWNKKETPNREEQDQ